MARITYPGTSPYANTYQTNWHIGLYEDRPVPPADDDIEFLVTNEFHQRPELLSSRLYGTPGYWWVFAQRNPNLIRDMIYDQVAGLTIWVPSASRVKTL